MSSTAAPVVPTSSRKANSSSSSALGLPVTAGSRHSGGCCSTGSAARRWKWRSTRTASHLRSIASACARSPGSPTARPLSFARLCTSTPSGNVAIRRRVRSPSMTSRCYATPTRRCRRHPRTRSSTLPVSPGACRWTLPQSTAASSRSSPSTTVCSSARPPRSIITPIASRAVPGRRVCPSSMTPCR
jgi:hypothetical protein